MMALPPGAEFFQVRGLILFTRTPVTAPWPLLLTLPPSEGAELQTHL